MRLVNAEGWPSESVGAMERRPSHALVTGGGGFLGRYIVEQLVARGDRVTTFSRGSYPELAALGARQVRGDLRDLRAITAACRGGDGSPVDVIDRPPSTWSTTWLPEPACGPVQRLLRSQRHGHGQRDRGLPCHGRPQTGLHELLRSVIFDGTDQRNVDESMPYPNHYESPYPETKAIGEQRVLAASSSELLTTSRARTSSSGHATTTCCLR